MIRGIHHTAIAWPAGTEVADKITGLERSSARAVMLHAGNALIELFQYESPSPRPGDPERPVSAHGITHVCLDVEDLDAEYERLKAAGMQFHCPPQDLGVGIKTTYGRDPDGNVIELQEILAAESPIALRA
jgi:catechol 2,3-dioxygenase-like lactoylglutathione lyase family enzyme